MCSHSTHTHTHTVTLCTRCTVNGVRKSARENKHCKMFITANFIHINWIFFSKHMHIYKLTYFWPLRRFFLHSSMLILLFFSFAFSFLILLLLLFLLLVLVDVLLLVYILFCHSVDPARYLLFLFFRWTVWHNLDVSFHIIFNFCYFSCCCFVYSTIYFSFPSVGSIDPFLLFIMLLLMLSFYRLPCLLSSSLSLCDATVQLHYMLNWPMEQMFASAVLLLKSIATTHKLTFGKVPDGRFLAVTALRLQTAFDIFPRIFSYALSLSLLSSSIYVSVEFFFLLSFANVLCTGSVISC